jgi:hypothetical protein
VGYAPTPAAKMLSADLRRSAIGVSWRVVVLVQAFVIAFIAVLVFYFLRTNWGNPEHAGGWDLAKILLGIAVMGRLFAWIAVALLVLALIGIDGTRL